MNFLATYFSAGVRHASTPHPRLMHWLISLGAIGVFGVAFLDASIVPLPIPGTTDLLMLILIAHGGSPWLLASLAVTGSVVGGLLTWSTGKKGGEAALQRYVPKKRLKKITGWVERRGAVAILLSTIMPPPVPLLPFLLAAGALGCSKTKFVTAFTAGRAIRYGVVAWFGVLYGHQMVRWWDRYLAKYTGVISWVIFALFAAGIAWAVWQWRRGGKRETAAPQAAKAPADLEAA